MDCAATEMTSRLPTLLLVRKDTDERAISSAWRCRSTASADGPAPAPPFGNGVMADAAPQSPGSGGPSCGTLAACAGAGFTGNFE